MRKMIFVKLYISQITLNLMLTACSDASQTSISKATADVIFSDDTFLFDEHLLDAIPQNIDFGGPIDLSDMKCSDGFCSAKVAFDGRTYSLYDLQWYFNLFDGNSTIMISNDSFPAGDLPDQMRPCRPGELCSPISIASGVDPDNGAAKDVTGILDPTTGPSLKWNGPVVKPLVPLQGLDTSSLLNIEIPDYGASYEQLRKQQDAAMSEAISQIQSQPSPEAVMTAIALYRSAVGKAYDSFRTTANEILASASTELDQNVPEQKFAASLIAISSGLTKISERTNKRAEQLKAAKAELPNDVPSGYNNLKSPPTSSVGQIIRDDIFQIQKLEADSISLTNFQKDLIQKAKDILRQADSDFGDTPEHDLLNRLIVAKAYIDLAKGKRVNWKEIGSQKIQCLGKEISNRGKNKLRSAEYAKLYNIDPETFKWAGMAAFASDLVGLGIKAGEFLKNYPDYAGVIQETEDFMAAGNAAVFNDIYWQHEAYLTGGIEEIRRLEAEDRLDGQHLRAWEMIDSGRVKKDMELVWRGNGELLRFEQFVTLQPIYDRYPDLSKLLSPFMISPIPGDVVPFQAVVPLGNIGSRLDRWKWIENSMLPAYRKLSDGNRNQTKSDLSTIISKSSEVCK